MVGGDFVRALLLGLILALVLPACAPVPSTLSPAGKQAIQNTRVIKGLDLLRDAAVDANAATPPILSTETTRKIVTWHRSTLLVIQASGNGWQAAVKEALVQLQADIPSPAERARLAPYFTLINSLLAEVL
jgi:hypothetical protein